MGLGPKLRDFPRWTKMKKVNSNWSTFKSHISQNSKENTNFESQSSTLISKRKRTDLNDAIIQKFPKLPESKPPIDQIPLKIKQKYIGLDCEMVGIGSEGRESALARCCLVDFDGNVLYDSFVRPPSLVTDFRTKWSGVRKVDLREAISLKQCRDQVCLLLKGKILVGHALKNDLNVLMLSHPRHDIRDTATFKPFMRPHGRGGGKFRPRALRDLSKQFLGIEIQTGEHDPSEDARTAMLLYRLKRKEWESELNDQKLGVKGDRLHISKNKVEREGGEHESKVEVKTTRKYKMNAPRNSEIFGGSGNSNLKLKTLSIQEVDLALGGK